jgi:DNA-binding CsgD family transcriptional regulator
MTRPPHPHPDALPEALEELPLPSYTYDRNLTITWMNPALVELIGDHTGEPLLTVVSPEHLTAVRLRTDKMLRGETPPPFETELESGEKVEVDAVPLKDGGHVVGVWGLALTLPRPSERASKKHANNPLTPRQRDVLHLMAAGGSSKQIARELHISRETANNHARAILRAFNVHSRLAAVAAARQAGLIE